jgi:UDP-N-acetylmuramoyl-tripeptide--D-alanyl-D-alanine ligase
MKDLILKLLTFLLKVEAKLIVKKYKPTIIGITGNVGKTSTRKAIYTVIKEFKKTRTSSKNFNNELGLPTTIITNKEGDYSFSFWLKVLFEGIIKIILKDKNYPEILIIEYGIDKPKDMDKLLEIAKPHIGVMTIIGKIPVHIEFFKNREEIVNEKAKMISSLPLTGVAVLNEDSIDIQKLKQKTKSYVITYGFKKNADIRIKKIETKINKKELKVTTTIKIAYDKKEYEINLKNSAGKPLAYEVSAAFLVGLLFGIQPEKIADILSKSFEAQEGRGKILNGIKNSFIIDDTYNASPLSMEEALNTLKNIKAKRKIAVLGDMLELGVYSLKAHEEIGKIAASICNLIITIGERGKIIGEAAIKSGFNKKNIYHFQKIEEVANFLKENIKKDDLILLKASQGVRLEKVVKEIIANKEDIKYLVRQSSKWLAKKGFYD